MAYHKPFAFQDSWFDSSATTPKQHTHIKVGQLVSLYQSRIANWALSIMAWPHSKLFWISIWTVDPVILIAAPPKVSVHLAVPDKTITPVGAEVHWNLRLKSSILEDSRFELTIVQLAETGDRVHFATPPYLIQKLTGLHSFSDLQPDTAYSALLTITYPGLPHFTEHRNFKTKGIP